MKKGFTMIELIFVIVILGILASVAIPRLAGTREDAEISAAVANLRTLVSDASAYYTVKSGFGTGDSGTKWNEITKVPLNNPNGAVTSTDGNLRVGGKDCIAVRVQNGTSTAPAHILFLKKGGGAICKQVQNAEPLKAYFNSTVNGVTTTPGTKGAVAIGSNTSVYGPIAAIAAPAVAASASAATVATTAAAVATATGARPGGAAVAPIGESRPTVATVATTTGARPGGAAVATTTQGFSTATTGGQVTRPQTPVVARPAPAESKPAESKPAESKPAWVVGITSPATPGSPVATAAVVFSGSKPAVPAAPIMGSGSRPQGHFSTATGAGKVTNGKGTGSRGFALPSFFGRR